jgi:hypothetical protein
MLNTTITPDTSATVSLSSAAKPATTTKPVVGKVTISRVTATSVVLSWHSNAVAAYTVKYGLSPDALTATDTLQSTSKDVSVSLDHLPAGKKIYVSILPDNNGAVGNANLITFKTTSQNIITPIVIILLIILVIIAILIKKFGKKPVELPVPHPDEPLLPPPFPEETKTAYNERINWWLPVGERQEGRRGRGKPEDLPDMFEEGRKRLDEEERQRQLPKKK